MATYSSGRRGISPLAKFVGAAAILSSVYFLGNTRTQEQENDLYNWALQRADMEGDGDGHTTDKEMRGFCRKHGISNYDPEKPSTLDRKGFFFDDVERYKELLENK